MFTMRFGSEDEAGRKPSSSSTAVASALLSVALLTAGCGSNARRGDATPIVSAACTDPSAPIEITDDTNYALSDSFTIERHVLKDATDLVFHWGGLTTDFFGKAIDPTKDINLVLISLWSLTPDAIEEALRHDSLPLSANVGALTTYPDGTYTSQSLTGFNLLGNPLPTDEVWKFFDTKNPNFVYPQQHYTFLIMANTGTVLSKGARMMAMFTIDPAATETELTLTDSSTKLGLAVNLTTASPVKVPAATPSLVVDWSKMTKNAIGNEYIRSEITTAVAAHFPFASAADLEPQFLRLPDIADGWWQGSVAVGSSIDLGTLVNAEGSSFPGIDANGVWIAALYCTENCNNPAPWSITFLEPCD